MSRPTYIHARPFAFGLGLALLGGSAHAVAVDAQTYAGASCVANTWIGAGDVDVGLDGTLTNTAVTLRPVLCPIVRDRVEEAQLDNIWVRLDHTGLATSYQTTSCMLTARSFDGSSLGTVSRSYTGTGRQALWFGGWYPYVSSYSSDYYAIECDLAPGAQLVSYRVDEFN